MALLCTCCGFIVLHDNRLTHTDLKPENILFANSAADIVFDVVKVGIKSRGI